MSYPEPEWAETEKTPGAVDHLREAIDNIHTEISRMTGKLGPVLTPEGPQAVAEQPEMKMVGADIHLVLAQAQNAVERLAALRGRLVI